jgi:hypothetical protein
MSLSESAKRKMAKVGITNLPGFYQFNSKEEAITIINVFEQYINEDGSLQKHTIDACCDPIYQQLSAAIDYYKFNVVRPQSKYSKYFTNK